MKNQLIVETIKDQIINNIITSIKIPSIKKEIWIGNTMIRINVRGKNVN